ncbi:hypothetical protein P0F65_05425 [Sphingomonas sp. I4]
MGAVTTDVFCGSADGDAVWAARVKARVKDMEAPFDFIFHSHIVLVGIQSSKRLGSAKICFSILKDP